MNEDILAQILERLNAIEAAILNKPKPVPVPLKKVRERLGCHSRTTYCRWRSEGKTPPEITIGGRDYVMSDVLETWISSH